MGHGYEGEASSQKLAYHLGISVEDFDSYAVLDENASEDGHLYSYVVTFDPSTPKEILEAAGTGDTLFVHVPLSVFDEEE